MKAKMRSRRNGLVAIIIPNAASSTVRLRKNILPLTPPRNSTPSAISAITTKAPMSGSASSNTPMKASASAIGHTAWMNRSLTSILRTM